MSKRLFLIASSCFLFFSFSKNVKAQSNPHLFKLSDTVCYGTEVVPTDVVDGAQNYNWSFCPPNLGDAPDGSNTGPIVGLEGAVKGLVLAKDSSIDYVLALDSSGNLTRYRYPDGYATEPAASSAILATIPEPGGLFAVETDMWHVFVLSGSGKNVRLTRFDFKNGLKAMPEQKNLGNLGGKLDQPKLLYIAQDQNNWFGFSFSKDDDLLRLDFGNNLMAAPSVTNLGNPGNNFSGASAITGIAEWGNWYLFVTNINKNNVDRVAFGNSLTNTPFISDLGDMNSRIKAPVGIAITKGCDAYFAYILNAGTASFVTLEWDNKSITTPPVPTNHGNVAAFMKPSVMSGIVSDSGALYMFAANGDKSFSKIIFNPCTSSTIATSDQQYPPSFAYNEPGIYPVYLTINQGLPTVQTDCKQIVVTDRPPITISNDTLICQWDTLDLSALTIATDSFYWQPNYNISKQSGHFIKAWPDHSTRYSVTAFINKGCIVTQSVDVKVSKIVADAGPDRIISDGSATVLGGGKTTIGGQYTYLWTPDIGLITSATAPVIKAIPPYDLTYYLHVSNSDGCQAIDSAIVSTPCDKLNLPNAFVPESPYPATNRFGLLNQQLAKINYFKIFDRWGKEVFSTTDPKGSWDGTVNGNPAPMGVYVWEVDANCANTQKRYRQTGTVTLIR